MKIKEFIGFIRGWLPQEPKLPKKLQVNSKRPVQSKLRFTNSIKIVYGLTMGFVIALPLVFILDYIWAGTSSISVLTVLMWNLPYFFLINTIPLAIFSVIFLIKGNGLNYFRSWKAGRKLLFSGLAIVAGYTSIAFQHFYFPFSANIISWEGPGFQVSPSYYYLIYFGLSLIAIGFVSLIFYSRNHI